MSQQNATNESLPTCDDTTEQALEKIRAEFRRTLDASYECDEGLRAAKAQVRLLEARAKKLAEDKEVLLRQFSQLAAKINEANINSANGEK